MGTLLVYRAGAGAARGPGGILIEPLLWLILIGALIALVAGAMRRGRA